MIDGLLERLHIQKRLPVYTTPAGWEPQEERELESTKEREARSFQMIAHANSLLWTARGLVVAGFGFLLFAILHSIHAMRMVVEHLR